MGINYKPHDMGLTMTNDIEDHLLRMGGELQIWDHPQFTVADVCKITGTTAKALEHFLNPARGLVRLMGDWVNPGTGKRRLFTRSQVLKIAAAYAMNGIGFPQRWSIEISEMVDRRARGADQWISHEYRHDHPDVPLEGAEQGRGLGRCPRL